MAKVRWNGSDALCPRCNKAMRPADLIRGLSFLEERVYICPCCGPVVDGAGDLVRDVSFLRKAG